MPDYNGPERRQDYVQLEQALEQVERLHGAVSTLATAVTNTVPRRELEDLRAEVKKDFLIKIYLQIGLTVAFIFFFVIFINMKFNRMDGSVKKGHEVILCMQGKTESQRTGDAYQAARVICEQTTK